MHEELTAPVIAEPARTRLLTRLSQLDQLMADEVDLSLDAAGAVTELTKDDKGSYRLGSAPDPEATYRIHGEKKVEFGYTVNVAITDHFVREISAVTGAQPVANGVATLITEQLKHHDVQPQKFIYAAATGTGKARANFLGSLGIAVMTGISGG